jgi:hypothetical protein
MCSVLRSNKCSIQIKKEDAKRPLFFIPLSLIHHILHFMAANIFTPNDFDRICHRIDKLSSGNNRRWGTMSLTQMMAHCSIQLELALDSKKTNKLEGPGIMRTHLGRYLALYVLPWVPGLPAPEKMNTSKNDFNGLVFEEERKRLLHLLKKLRSYSGELNAHPFFGLLNRKDWGRLVWKHLDYHLRQFSA